MEAFGVLIKFKMALPWKPRYQNNGVEWCLLLLCNGNSSSYYYLHHPNCCRVMYCYSTFLFHYCHHLASVVCKLFTFQASSKPLGQLEPNLAGMFLGWSSTKLLFFVPVGYSTCLPGPIICSDWLKFQRSSSLKLMNWLNPSCKWMIIGMSFTKFLFFMPIGNPRWPPSQDID